MIMMFKSMTMMTMTIGWIKVQIWMMLMSGVSTLRRGVFHFSRLETAVLIMMIFFMMINRMIMRVMMIDMMIMIMLIIAWDGFTQQN